MTRGARTKQQVTQGFNLRSAVVLGVFVAAGLGLFSRAFYLQVYNKDFLNEEADNRHVRTATISAHRGMITDRNGETLAVSLPVDSIWAEPKKLAAAVDRLGPLARALGMDEQELVLKLAGGADKEFLYLKRRLQPSRAEAVMSLGLPGVNTLREYARFYPNGEVASHIVGYTNIDDQGQAGLEVRLDNWLAGEPGAKRVLKDRRGNVFENVGSVRPAREGRVATSSIDLRIQYFAYRALKKAMLRYEANTGSIVVMDVPTGQVLAMVSQPGFNPNDRAQMLPNLEKNRAIVDLFEPGSSIKPFIVASALDSGRFRPSSIIDTSPGRVEVGDRTIEDPSNYGEISLTTLLQRSSNVGAIRLARELPAEHIWTTLTALGFGQVSGGEFHGEQRGELYPHQEWSKVVHSTVAYGYGLSVTNLQLAQAYAALGNGGILQPATVLMNSEGLPGHRVLSEDSARAVVRMLEEVVRADGTGRKAQVDGYRVAGKTGTAKKADSGYAEGHYVSVFGGIAPATKPRLAIVVVIDEPSEELYAGGDVAAPVFAEVMSESLRLLAVPPDAAPILRADAISRMSVEQAASNAPTRSGQ